MPFGIVYTDSDGENKIRILPQNTMRPAAEQELAEFGDTDAELF